MDKQIIGRPYEGPTELVRFADPAPYASPPPSQGLSLGRILGIIRGRLLIFAIALIVLMALATVGILNLKRSYQSDALLVIEPNKPHVTNLQAIEDAPEIRSDLVVIWSQIQILESDTLARKVVTAMHLQNDPAFAEAPPIWTAWLNWISKLPGLAAINSAPEPKTDAQLINETIVRYKQRFSAYSDGKSFVIATSFSAPDPDLARRILAEHLKVYLDDQTIAKQAIIGKADVWFQGELSEMQTKLQQAEAKQQMFRDDNHLLRTGADAETIAGRQLSTVTGQLADARADLARKEARYNEIASLAASKSVDAVSEDPTIMASPLIQRLREQEATAAQRLVEQQQRGYQPGSNTAVSSAAASLAEVQQRIIKEVRRMAAAAANDVQIARGNTDRLQQSVTDLESQLGITRSAELKVNDLEREIHADRTLYEDLLSRSRQVAVQREIQTPDARIVSDPTSPLRASFPRYKLFFAIAATISGLLAAGLVILLDMRDEQPSLGLEEIEAECDLAGLGALPRVRRSQRRVGTALPPHSQLAASLQTVQNSISFRNGVRQPQIVAFTSALPGDGKTLVASLYAASVASTERRVLLIDADLRRSLLARSFASKPGTRGTVSVLQKKSSLMDSVVTNPALGIDVLVVEAPDHIKPELVLKPEFIVALMAEARQHYDVIVIDTPPVVVVDDALAFARLADVTVMVIRWGRTPARFIRAALRRLNLAEANVIGGVLNGVDPRKRNANSMDVETYRLYTKSYLS